MFSSIFSAVWDWSSSPRRDDKNDYETKSKEEILKANIDYSSNLKDKKTDKVIGLLTWAIIRQYQY